MLRLDVEDYKVKAKLFSVEALKILKESRTEVITSSFEIDGKTLHIPESHKKFLKNHLNDKFLKELILKTPKEQIQLIEKLEQDFPSIHYKKTRIYQIIKQIFITKGYEKIKKAEFYRNMNIKTCIYCNRNYIYDLKENGHRKGHLDHFYPKARYPYLAMSFYNLIPVCESCNKIKGEYNTVEKNSINPYERKKSKLFNIEINSTGKFSYRLTKDDLIEKLLIEKTYNEGHEDILNELYIKFYQENTSQHFISLGKSLKLKFGEDEVYKFITCGYLDEQKFHKRSFSKMTNDIVKDEFEKYY